MASDRDEALKQFVAMQRQGSVGYGLRQRFPNPPTEGNAATGRAAEAAVSVTDPSQLVPGQDPGKFAPQATPDYDALKKMAEQSSFHASMGAIKPAASMTNANPQAIGDNPLGAYVQKNNDAQAKIMQDQVAKKQGDVNMFNNLLEAKQNDVKRYAEEAASGDRQMAENEMQNRKDIQQMKGKVSLGTARIGADAKLALGKANIFAAMERLNHSPGAEDKAMEARRQLELASQTMDAAQAVRKTIPTEDGMVDHIQGYANENLPGFVADHVNNLAGKLSTFDHTTAMTALESRIATAAHAFGDRALMAQFNNMKSNLASGKLSNAQKHEALDQLQEALQSSINAYVDRHPGFAPLAGANLGDPSKPVPKPSRGPVPAKKSEAATILEKYGVK